MTGSDEPARKGKPRRFEASTMALRLGEAVREVLVVEDRNGPAIGLEYVDHLPEELVARVENLPFLVARIVAVLTDDQNPIDGELRAAAAQGLGDCRVHLETEAPGALGALIEGGLLIHVKRRDLDRGAMPLALEADNRRGIGRPCAGRATGTARRS